MASQELHRIQKELEETNRLLQREVEERREAEKITQLLLRIIHSIHGARNLQQALKTVVVHICEAFDFDVGLVWEHRSDGTIGLSDVYHFQSPIGEALLNQSFDTRFRPGKGLIGRVQAYNLAEIVKNIQEVDENTFHRRSVALNVGIKSAMSFPLPADGVKFIVSFYCAEVIVDGDDVVRVINGIINQLHTALMQQAHEEQLQQANQQLQLLNEQLAAQKLELEHKNQELKDFAYVISHDLRGPIINLQELVGILVEESAALDGQDLDDLLQQIGHSARSLRQTVFALAKALEARKDLVAVREPADLHAVLRDSRRTLEKEIKETGAVIKEDFSAISSVPIHSVHLKSIFQNLISNSIKYRKPDVAPHIEIFSRQEPQGFSLTFRDNGLGFDAERYGHKLFKIFQRLHHHADGTGIGLYIVNSIVHSYGGEIEVQSWDGEGAEFKLIFK